MAAYPERRIYGNFFNKHRSRNPLVKIIMDRYRNTLRKMLDPQPGEEILEVGCGEGELLRWLSDLAPTTRWAGVDLVPWVYEPARNDLPDVSFSIGECERLPFDDRRFDKILCCQVLEHVDHPQRALDEIRRTITQYAVLTVPCEPLWRILNCLRGKYWSHAGNSPGHIHHWSPSQFEQLLRQHFSAVTLTLRSLPFLFARVSR